MVEDRIETVKKADVDEDDAELSELMKELQSNPFVKVKVRAKKRFVAWKGLAQVLPSQPNFLSYTAIASAAVLVASNRVRLPSW